MLKYFLRTRQCLLVIALCISSCAISGCVESNFRIASESRLPRGLAIPPGLTRADVSVTMNYYTPLRGPDVKFILKDRKGKKLATIEGMVKCQYLSSYPSYVVIAANGTTEIIEHRRMEPIIYVTDDPAVRTDLLTTGCAGPLHAN